MPHECEELLNLQFDNSNKVENSEKDQDPCKDPDVKFPAPYF